MMWPRQKQDTIRWRALRKVAGAFRSITGGTMSLEMEFHHAMIGVYSQAKAIGYNATRFLQMVDTDGGVNAAKKLLAKQDIQSGLGWLWQNHRLDISMEALVLQEPFRGLFTDCELAEAQRRLNELNYVPGEPRRP